MAFSTSLVTKCQYIPGWQPIHTSNDGLPFRSYREVIGVTGDLPSIYSVSSIGKDADSNRGYLAARPKAIQMLLPLVDFGCHKSIGLRGSQSWSTEVLQSCYPASQVLDSPAVIHHTP